MLDDARGRWSRSDPDVRRGGWRDRPRDADAVWRIGRLGREVIRRGAAGGPAIRGIVRRDADHRRLRGRDRPVRAGLAPARLLTDAVLLVLRLLFGEGVETGVLLVLGGVVVLGVRLCAGEIRIVCVALGEI